MRLCMPTINEQGLAARLSGHFGSARYFTLIETDTRETSVLVNEHARHEHGHCDPLKGLAGHAVDAVVCRGLGLRALSALDRAGIRVLVTDRPTVAAALAAFGEGSLAPMTPETACEGDRHLHGHGRGHGGA